MRSGLVTDEKGRPIAQHIINGKNHWWEPMIKVFNPTTGQVIGKAPANLFYRDMGELYENAHKAQQCWYYEVTEQEKEQVFRAIITKIEEYRGALARTMIIEGGKLWRWADAEVQETIDTLWHYHGEISRCYTHDGFTRCQMPDKNAFSILKPYGVVLGITPWNFPLAILFWKMCGALAGGNSIVIKPAEQTPFTAEIAVGLVLSAIGEVISDNRQKQLSGLVQLVHGRGETSGKLLLEQFNYDKVAFTGSVETGKIIASTSGSRLKPCHLELGGHAAMIVLDDFDIDLAVAEAINANLGDSGQRCVSARVVFVQDSGSRYREFVNKYTERAHARVIGDPMNFSTEMGPLISAEQLERVESQITKTISELGRLPDYGKDSHSHRKDGYYCGPIVFTEVPYGVTAMEEEIFGPVMVINRLRGRDREEAFWNAVELVNKSKYGLSNALLTNDRRLTSRAPWHLQTGLLYIGRGTTGAELNKYFGGVKNSGWGREGRGLDDWTQIVQVYDDYHGKARMAQAGGDEKVKKLISESRSPLE
ncbi:MAG: aldehyde dehydrogenase family protein [bacterium]|nr:aldehyde dehydrogenase family protein [bacterium]